MLIASGQQVDSIKFAPSETKALIKAWENYPKLKKYADSTDKQLIIVNAQKINDSTLLYAANDVIKSKNQVISAHENLTNSNKTELKHERTWRKIWKSVAGGLGVIVFLETTFLYFTH